MKAFAVIAVFGLVIATVTHAFTDVGSLVGTATGVISTVTGNAGGATGVVDTITGVAGGASGITGGATTIAGGASSSSCAIGSLTSIIPSLVAAGASVFKIVVTLVCPPFKVISFLLTLLISIVSQASNCAIADIKVNVTLIIKICVGIANLLGSLNISALAGGIQAILANNVEQLLAAGATVCEIVLAVVGVVLNVILCLVQLVITIFTDCISGGISGVLLQLTNITGVFQGILALCPLDQVAA